MAVTIVSAVLIIAAVYLLTGLLFALFFVFKLVDHFDHQAAGAPFSFQLIILPASILLWIFLLIKIIKNKKG
ncbi:MAG: hypothetical protein LH473_12280 [Chitinophagales bacterium]|nr:hypothetical protein [Chitinophagales bacterium]